MLSVQLKSYKYNNLDCRVHTQINTKTKLTSRYLYTNLINNHYSTTYLLYNDYNLTY